MSDPATRLNFPNINGFYTIIDNNPSDMFTSDLDFGTMIWDIPLTLPTATTLPDNYVMSETRTITVYSPVNTNYSDSCSFNVRVFIGSISLGLTPFANTVLDKFICQVGTTWSFGKILIN